jgi:NAD(P)H-hydrate epimerase
VAAFPLDNTHLLKQHLPTLLTMTESARESAHGKVAVVIGGGMGRSQETQETILEYLSNINVSVVIDADAIHAIAKRLDVLAGKPFLITPNTFELTLLGGRDVRPLELDQRIQEAQAIATKLGTTLLLKGKTDIITNGTDVALNETGSPYMSIGGAGDTLAGIAGALLARGVDAFTAAQAAAYINGKAGELAGKKFKESLVATDIIDSIPEVIQ